MEKEIQKINVDSILLNPHQPRINFEEQQIVELADSINENGLIQPIVVRRTDDGYELVAGERRLRATMYLKKPEIDAIVTSYDDNESAKVAIIENIQRENLSAIEEAIAYEKLIKDHSYTQSQLAASLGKSQSTIANKMRLLNLNETVKQEIINKNINERQGRALLKVTNHDQQIEILNKIIEDKMNVAQTEKYIERKLNTKKRPVKKAVVSTKDYRLEINTIKQAVDMIAKTGTKTNIDISENKESEDVTITITLKK